MTDRSVPEALAHDDRGLEQDRLEAAFGLVELERTVEILASICRGRLPWSPTSAAVRGTTRSGWPAGISRAPP